MEKVPNKHQHLWASGSSPGTICFLFATFSFSVIMYLFLSIAAASSSGLVKNSVAARKALQNPCTVIILNQFETTQETAECHLRNKLGNDPLYLFLISPSKLLNFFDNISNNPQRM